MSIRDIIIGGDENGEGGVGVFRGTSFKDTPEYSSDMIKCFDENVNQGSDVVGGTIEIEKLVYDSRQQYIDLRDKLKAMKVDHIQGFYYSKTIPEDDFLKLINQ